MRSCRRRLVLLLGYQLIVRSLTSSMWTCTRRLHTFQSVFLRAYAASYEWGLAGDQSTEAGVP